MLLLTLSGEIHLKSSRTRRRFQRIVRENLQAGLARTAPGAEVFQIGAPFLGINAPDPEAAAQVAARTFGVVRVDEVRRIDVGSFDDLVATVAAAAQDQVAGKVFAVRAKRGGSHNWTSKDLERAVGTALFAGSAGVDLVNPEVEVRLRVQGNQAYLVERSRPGPRGLPLGSQDRLLALLSGGFDSVVAAWMMMSRGSPVDFVHFKLDCAQSDHALAVGEGLLRNWGHGAPALAHVVDFQEIKEVLHARVDARLRQVVLKQLMMEAAERVAAESGIGALVTGEAVGQVSSQTLVHLIEIERATRLPVLRPLLALPKEEIIDRARAIGTYDLSARAKEVCDLSAGERVAVAASRDDLDAAKTEVAGAVLDKALETMVTVDLGRWVPGMSFESETP
jgi:thiamine biosynthesis protein ThiI